MAGLFLFTGLNQANAQAPGFNPNQAIAAAKSTCGVYTGPNASYEVLSQAIGICINGGTFYSYEVYVVFSCPPQHLTTCLPAPPLHAATVTYNCDGEVSVICHEEF